MSRKSNLKDKIQYVTRTCYACMHVNYMINSNSSIFCYMLRIRRRLIVRDDNEKIDIMRDEESLGCFR